VAATAATVAAVASNVGDSALAIIITHRGAPRSHRVEKKEKEREKEKKEEE